MVKIVVDTNFLLIPFQFRVDVFREAERLLEERTEFVVLSPCVAELKAMSAGKEGTGRDRRAAKAALTLLEKMPVKVAKAAGAADDAIIDYAVKHKAVVCTNDRELRKKLRENGARVIGLREKSHLAFA